MTATVHLIYSTPSARWRPLQSYNNFCIKNGILPPLYRHGNEFLTNWPKPIFAPFSISYYLLCALKTKYKVKLYSYLEKEACEMKPEDILLMHPNPDSFAQGTPQDPWMGCDKNSICWKTLQRYPNAKCTLILPYSHLAHKAAWLNDILQNYTKNLIVICGKYWTDNWTLSPYAEQNCNLLQVNMSIDATQYPAVKTTFNPPGKRKFLYIGHTSAYKNTQQLEMIARSYQNFQGAHIGHGHIEGWPKIAQHLDLNANNIQKLAQEFDIFVNCSIADAQATTILEQMCLGFAIACSKESGYIYPSLFYLDTQNTEFNCNELRRIQNLPTSELLERAKQNRIIAEQQHNWHDFTNAVIGFLQKHN